MRCKVAGAGAGARAREGAAALALLVAGALLSPGVRAASSATLLDAFRLRNGSAWTLATDPASRRPRSLVGGAVGWGRDATESDFERRALAFLTSNAALLDLDPALLLPAPTVVSARDGDLVAIHVALGLDGVPVDGARITLVVSHGNLIGVHLVGTETVRASPLPAVSSIDALDAAFAATRLERRGTRVSQARLVFVREANGHRLAWITDLVTDEPPQRLRVRIDARSGEVIAISDETVLACAPPTGALHRITGGVRTTRADAAEREEPLAWASADAVVTGEDATYASASAGTLTGSVATVTCVGCANPAEPRALADLAGNVSFGIGGVDQLGNGTSTPSDRATLFHVGGMKRLASRWLALPWLDRQVLIRTNVPASCNAWWNGVSLNFERASARCSNTGEIRDVIVHEWGHGLDDNDGIAPPGLEVDAATGEAVADILAMLRSRDPCIGESFFADEADFPSPSCSGVRDLDETARDHRRGEPATLTTGNVAAKCSASAFYRGPLGREGHCEGEILGQAAWHLAQGLLGGVSLADGRPLPDGALGEEASWQLMERLFLGARVLMASYAPSTMQAIGMSAHEALLLVDDESDGLANGTPHAAAIHDALEHHGLIEPALASLPDTMGCVAPADPALMATAELDPALGRPVARLRWPDVGAAGYRLLRSDDTGDAFLAVGARRGPGAGDVLDRGVLPGRTYRYAVVAESGSGCLSPGNAVASVLVGSALRVVTARIDDALALGGNANGLLEAGETADLELDLTVEGAPATNVLVTLTSPDPAVAIVDGGPLSYGRIDPGMTTRAPAAFRVRAAAARPRFVVLRVQGEASEGCLGAEHAIEIAGPDLVLAGAQIDDSSGNGDGKWQTGETIDVAFTLRNDGLLAATGVDGRIRFRGVPPPGVTIVRDAASWPVIATGAEAPTTPPGFALRADTSIGLRTKVLLDLDVQVGGAPHATHPTSLTVGAFPQGSLEWSAGIRHIMGTPIVIQLDDDDGDGRIGACDIPDVVATFNGSPQDAVIAINGATHDEMWRHDEFDCVNPSWDNAMAGGDVNLDGRNEIALIDNSGHVCLFDDGGTVIWRTAAPTRVFGTTTPVPQIFDLDGDGDVEIVSGGTVLNGADGSVAWEASSTPGGRTLVGDLDLDGQLEVVVSQQVYRADGTLTTRTVGGHNGHDPGGLVNLDDDPLPEICFFNGGRAECRDDDGRRIFERRDLPETAEAPPCFADFDGDGRAEMAFTTDTRFFALDDDGTTLWSIPVLDQTGLTAGCSCFDFDGDGRVEIVHHDSEKLRILDSLDGEVLWSWDVAGGTRAEIPAIADVDGDGAAEIVLTFAEDGRGYTLQVFGNPAWRPARRVWNQEDYSVTHVREDGSIVSRPVPRWLVSNDFRTQDGGCACGVDASLAIRSNALECGTRAACFELEPGVLDLVEREWDFGDGSPRASEAAPCHVFPGRGPYLVRATGRDEEGCTAYGITTVTFPEQLVATFVPPAGCATGETCLTAVTSGGMPPYEIAWDFGDGSPAINGSPACHEIAGAGVHELRLLVRDARGCLAESVRTVEVATASDLPEISGPGADPLLVSKSASTLVLEFEDAAWDVGVYEGSIASLRPAGYTHAATSACRRRDGRATLAMPASDRYFLVAAAACPIRIEGSYGASSRGTQRPSATDLGRLTCP